MAGSLGQLLPNLAYLDAVVQDNTLVREFHDALFPQLLFRDEATPEKWAANIGDTQVFTRASLLPPQVTPITPGEDPTPTSPSFEQWRVKAAQYTDTIDTTMPASRTALAPLFARNAKSLGLQAGESMNRVCRNKLFRAYTGGNSVTVGTGAAATSVVVNSINGFTHVVVNGQEVPVSPTFPLNVTIAGVGTVQVIGASPLDANCPLGAGTLTLAAPATWADAAAVVSGTAPLVIRSGGAATIDGLTALNGLTLADIRPAVATMRRNRVPTHADGYYHVHLDPIAEAQLFGDNEFQRINQGVPDNVRHREMAVGFLMGCVFYSNSESPNVYNSGALYESRPGAEASCEYYADVRNAAGVAVTRTIITGGGSIMEKYIDENTEYMTEAGYTGKVGKFSVVNNGLVVNIDRVRYIIRAPLDRLQQQVAQTWSWSGDWGIPTDLLGGQTGSRYKRAIVIESGTND